MRNLRHGQRMGHGLSGPGGKTGAAPPSVFTPSSIASVGKYFWGDVDLGVQDSGSGTAASWTDQFAVGSPSQGTSGNMPPITVSDADFDGHGSLTLDGVSDSLVFTALDLPAPGTTPFFLYAILRQTGWTSGSVLFGAQLNTMQLQQNTSSPSIRMNNGTGANLNGAGLISPGTTVHVQALFTGSTSDYLRIGTTTTTGVSAGGNDPSLGNFTIGARTAGTANFAAYKISALVLLAGEPTEIAQLRTYFSTRFPSAVGP